MVYGMGIIKAVSFLSPPFNFRALNFSPVKNRLARETTIIATTNSHTIFRRQVTGGMRGEPPCMMSPCPRGNMHDRVVVNMVGVQPAVGQIVHPAI